MFTRKTLLLALSIIAALFVQSVHAEESPADLIKSTVDKVQKTTQANTGKISNEKLEDRLREIITPVFDFREMSRRCLGRNWKSVSPEQQKQFQEMFSELLAKSYLKQIRENAASSTFSQEGEKIRKSKSGRHKAVVLTKVNNDDGTIKIDYRMIFKNNAWKVYDVIIENIGLISNYRSEFSDILRKDGMDVLLSKLKEKLKK